MNICLRKVSLACATALFAAGAALSVNAADAAKTAPSTFKPGTYTATARGFGGDVTVTVTVDANAITDVTAVGDAETAGIGSNAIEQLPSKIVEANGTNGVEVVSGASMTSNAIFDAVNDCLTQASA